MSSTCPHNMVNLRPTSGWDRLTSLWYPCKFQLVLRLGIVTARHLVVGVSQTSRYWTEGATYIRHVWHWRTFLLPKSLLLKQTEIPRRNMENGDENGGGRGGVCMSLTIFHLSVLLLTCFLTLLKYTVCGRVNMCSVLCCDSVIANWTTIRKSLLIWLYLTFVVCLFSDCDHYCLFILFNKFDCLQCQIFVV